MGGESRCVCRRPLSTAPSLPLLTLTCSTPLFAPPTPHVPYIDARHDYCGCSEDIQNWWPKVKPGGIMAGHDYV